MTTFTPQKVTPEGGSISFSPAGGENTFQAPRGRPPRLRVRNGNSKAVQLTIVNRLRHVPAGTRAEDYTASIKPGEDWEVLVGDAYADRKGVVTFRLDPVKDVTAAVVE
jgi:hypothetical protein